MIAGDPQLFQIAPPSPSTSVGDVLLPQGGGNSSEIHGQAVVADQLDAKAEAFATVINRPAVMTVTELENITAVKLKKAFDSGDVESALNVSEPLALALALALTLTLGSRASSHTACRRVGVGAECRKLLRREVRPTRPRCVRDEQILRRLLGRLRWSQRPIERGVRTHCHGARL